jgi:cytochrome c2
MQTRFLVFILSFALATFAWPLPSPAQISIVPGSSSRGAELFQKKACVECHAFDGVGGKVAPDLAQRNESVRTPSQLASVLWNHAPQMWRAQQARHVQPMLDSAETADLFAYFYSLAYSTAPGNAAKGAHLFEEKSCASCHKNASEALYELPGARSASAIARSLKNRPALQLPISTWIGVNDPLVWAERMWNHSDKVYAELASNWPRFSAQDMVDLLTYLRSLPEARSQSATFQPGDPEQGRITFERSCESCHSFGSRTTEPKIDLLKRPAPSSLTGYVAAMWNHAPVMHSRAQTKFPVFGPGDMTNLVAYLFAQRYFDQEGNIQRGARVFETKNCVVCHEQQRRQTGAPDLTLATERYSPITISTAVWRHGASMFETIQRQKLTWPNLKPSEMLDLITFLNSRLVYRIARPD